MQAGSLNSGCHAVSNIHFPLLTAIIFLPKAATINKNRAEGRWLLRSFRRSISEFVWLWRSVEEDRPNPIVNLNIRDADPPTLFHRINTLLLLTTTTVASHRQHHPHRCCRHYHSTHSTRPPHLRLAHRTPLQRYGYRAKTARLLPEREHLETRAGYLTAASATACTA